MKIEEVLRSYGRWRDGFVSFLINGLFIGAAVVAIEHNHEETAAIIGFFELGFYSANIYNAVNNTHKYNRQIREKYFDDLDTSYGPPFDNTFQLNP